VVVQLLEDLEHSNCYS